VPDDRILPGQVVRSNAGRDAGAIYMVIGLKTPAVVLLVDGRVRKMAKPKTKNIRHISILCSIDQDITVKVASGKEITDEDIRRAIRAYAGTGE
jgi:ribosomal protein L14E/L6E/L27E